MLSLPEELLQLICENLRPRHRCRDRTEHDAKSASLKNISRANKTLRRIAQSVLFYHLDFQKREWTYLRATLHVILDQPYLAAFVRKVSASDWVSTNDLDSPTESELDAALATAKNLPLSSECSRDLWRGLRGGLDFGYEDPELALLLCLCTRLETLDLEIPGAETKSMVVHTMVDCTKLAPTTAVAIPFCQIREVYLWDVTYEGKVDVSGLKDFFQLPSLNKIHGEGFDDYDGGFNLPNICTQIQTMNLIYPMLSAKALEEILSICPRLTSLTLDKVYFVPCNQLRYTKCGDVLRRCATKLEHLTTTTSSYYHYLRPQGDILGSLDPLTQLKTVNMPINWLFDYTSPLAQQRELKDLLPDSLHSLRLCARSGALDSPSARDFLQAQIRAVTQDARLGSLSEVEINRDGGLRMTLMCSGWTRVWRHPSYFTLKRVS